MFPDSDRNMKIEDKYKKHYWNNSPIFNFLFNVSWFLIQMKIIISTIQTVSVLCE